MHRPFKISILIIFLLMSVSASAQYTKLLDFNGAAHGFEPWGSLISDGTFLYGMTSQGGTNNLGVVFKIRTDGADYEKLLEFAGATNGSFPFGSLYSDGTFLYGMTSDGGANAMGTIFKIMPDGSGYQKLLDFAGATNGREPYGSLISDGTFLYGMTLSGGTSDLGTVFKIMKNGTGYAKLFDFTGTANGASPYGDLLLDGTTLLGTTYVGGSNNRGIVFRIQTDGTGFTRTLNFSGYPHFGDEPMGSLVSDGTYLYGMTSGGGTSNDGTIFRALIDGTNTTILKHFRQTIGDSPFGSLCLVGTHLYGMTYQGGTGTGNLFKMKTDGTDYVTLFDFDTEANGWLPNGSLISDGTSLYGMTQQGNGVGDGGTLFKYDLPALPTITNFASTSGATGTTVTITGTNFSTTPENNFVYFNGWPAEVTASSITSITVSVPQAATTGRISVNVFGNTAASTSDFTVLPGGTLLHKYDWAGGLVGTLDTNLASMTTDGSGNVITGGGFSETTDFDPGPGELNLTAVGNFDGFVSKLNPQGELLWAFRIGDAGSDDVRDVEVDGDGNIYVTGNFSEPTVDFDPGPDTETLPAALPTSARFLAKYDPDGNFIWVRQTDSGMSGPLDIVITPDDNHLYLAGNFTDTQDFDPGNVGGEVTASGTSDAFILKLTTDGVFTWVRQFTGAGNAAVRGMDLDSDGNVLTTGFFNGTADFDPEGGSVPLTAAGTLNDSFISKLTAAGAYVWARRIGSPNVMDNASDLTVDIDDNVIVTGTFNANPDFDPGVPVVTMASEGAEDVFILKLDAGGDYVWVKTIGGTGSDLGYSIATDADGNIYYAGDYRSTVDFDPGPATYYLTSSAQFADQTYVSKLDPDGNFIWVWSTSGTANSWAELPNLALDINGDIILAGYLEGGTIDFDHDGCDPGITTGISYASFVAKLSLTATSSCIPDVVFTVQPSPISSCTGSAVFTVTASGDTNLVYQWQIDNSGFVDLANDATYSGVNTATLTITNVSSALNGSVYRVLVHGDNTSAVPSSSATLSVGTTPASPVISDPEAVCPSSPVTLTASGGSDGNYRWYDGAALIPGQTNASYVATSSTSTTTYGVTIHDGTCESAIVPVNVTVMDCISPGIIVYNALSPNDDGKNDSFFIENIDHESNRENKVTIFNRWGDVVFEADNYDNSTTVFKGLNASGKELPTGIYYYRIELGQKDSIEGYVSLKR